jgi:hypothetical protein
MKSKRQAKRRAARKFLKGIITDLRHHLDEQTATAETIAKLAAPDGQAYPQARAVAILAWDHYDRLKTATELAKALHEGIA